MEGSATVPALPAPRAPSGGVGPYRAPRWLPGGHAQTIWAARLAPRPRIAYRRETWDTPDGDVVAVDFVEPASAADGAPAPGSPVAGPSAAPASRPPPLVVLFHGLEGDARSHYALSLMAAVRARGWRGAVVHFRGCGGLDNRLPRAYHSGDDVEIDWALARMQAIAAGAPLHAVGVSLGGNALATWAGRRGTDAARRVATAVAVSAPQDLAAGAAALARGFSRVYTGDFLRTLRAKALALAARHPGLIDVERVRAARDFHDFDDAVTAPLHGFRDARDYWARSSCRRWLGGVELPLLMLNALNDPFQPATALARPADVSRTVRLDYPAEGGHVGFPSGLPPGRLDWLPARVLAFVDGRD